MPILQITDKEGHLLSGAGHEVLGVMTFPGSPERRRKNRLVAESWALVENARANDESSVSLPTETLADVLTAAEIEVQQEHTAKEFIYGQYAGWILGLVVICSEQYPEHASVSKAVEALEEAVLKDAVLPDGKPAPRSRAFLLKQWSRFEAVAHLFAAYEVISQAGARRHPSELFARDKTLLRLLAVGELYRQRAAAITVQRGRSFEPLLDPRATWTVPSNLQLPKMTLESASIPDEVIQAFQKYRAPQKL